MWKKLLIAVIALVGTSSVGYAYFNAQRNLNATSSSYTVNTSLYGKLGQKGVGPNGAGSIKKGDKILLKTTNPTTSKPIAWQLLTKRGNEWISISDSAYANIQMANDGSIYKTISSKGTAYASIDDSNSAPFYAKLNSDLSANDDIQYMSEFDNAIFDTCTSSGGYVTICDLMKNSNIYKMDGTPSAYHVSHYIMSDRSVISTQVIGIPAKDLTFNEDYWNMFNGSTNRDPESWSYINYTDGTIRDDISRSVYQTRALRPMISFDPSFIDNIVFALSQSDSPSQSYARITDPTVESYSSLYSATSHIDGMKARIYNPAIRIQFLDILNSKNESIKQIAKGNNVNIKFSGSSGADANGSPYTTSLLIFDQNNKFIQYQPLAQTSGSDQMITADTSTLAVGTYQIALVNEAYNESITSPADCSMLSDLKELEIVEPLSDLKFTPESNLVVNKNVNNGDKVGVISSKNGAGKPVYTILADPDFPDEYTKITLAADGKTVIVNGDPLDAGVYHFMVQAVDSNGDPNPPLEIKASFEVKKEDLKIAFNKPDQTKKSVEDAETPWNESATASSSNGVKITYSKVGGDIGLIDIDEDTGEITYKGDGAYGKVTIRATADDDPDTGVDNYNPASVEKEIIIAREVDGVVTPDSASSDTEIPTFAANAANVKTGGTIGTIKGILGTPDTIGGSTTTYSYQIKSGGDGSLFKVNSGTGLIQSNANLAVGSYHFTITVSDKWTSKDVAVTVNVGVAASEELKFYENNTSNTVIDKKEVNFTDTNVSVFATVKGSSNNNPVTYKIKDDSTNVITVNANSGAVTIKGVGTVTIVATKKGATGQADATAELTFTVKPVEQKFIYTTDSTLTTERPKKGEYYEALVETYAPNKTFNVYTKGNPAGSTVTYQLKPGSPTDVISVDPDGTIHILNASKNDQIGKVIVQAISHDPSGNYDDKTIELPINIEKGTRKISFSENPINVVSGTGSVTPNILVDGVLDTSGNAVIEVDPKENSVAWTNDGMTIQYEWEKEAAKDIKLHVTKPADRNYKAAEADGTLHILGADENVLTLSTPGKIIYGDHFTIRSTQDDSGSTNVQYKFETDNGVFISAPDVNGNKAEFDALAYSGSTEITIKVTRTADGELPLTKSVKIKVLPKPITIQIDDEEKKRLEDNPPLTYKDFTSQLVSWDGVKDDIDTSHIKLTTTAKKFSPIGTYPITAGSAQKQLNDNYPNYTFTIKDGKLNIKDNGNKDFWDDDDDGCPDLNITITDDDGKTILINGDKNDDGIPDYNIDINGDGKPDLNIDTDNDGKPDLNLVMLKNWKPSKCVEVNGIQYSSGISAKAEINVDLDGDGIPDLNIDTNGDMKADINISKDGKTASVNIANINVWKPDTDFTIKNNKFTYDTMKIDPLLNIDSDGDGRPDINIDLDGDGSADINIDIDGDGIPDTNIDSTGDGKPDINVDVDGDGEPDENIKEITEWKPGHNVDGDIPYDTMSFDDPENPDDSDQADDSGKGDGSNNSDDIDTDVNGAYYPGANMGGASTGDTTNMMIYMGLGCTSIGMMLLVLYKRKQED